jgi:hypothetical protein
VGCDGSAKCFRQHLNGQSGFCGSLSFWLRTWIFADEGFRRDGRFTFAAVDVVDSRSGQRGAIEIVTARLAVTLDKRREGPRRDAPELRLSQAEIVTGDCVEFVPVRSAAY